MTRYSDVELGKLPKGRVSPRKRNTSVAVRLPLTQEAVVPTILRNCYFRFADYWLPNVSFHRDRSVRKSDR